MGHKGVGHKGVRHKGGILLTGSWVDSRVDHMILTLSWTQSRVRNTVPNDKRVINL